MPEGFRLNEIATELGLSTSSVSELLNELRSDLLLQTGHFFPLTDAEFAALKASIAEHGQRAPVILGQHIPVVDGRHRILAILELGVPWLDIQQLEGLTWEQEHDIALALNVARRHLNRAQKEQVVRAELHRDPARSDRLIAAACGVHWDTVGAIRRRVAAETSYEPSPAELEAASQPPSETDSAPPAPTVTPERRRSTDGRMMPASQPPRPAPEPEPNKPLGYVHCGSCGRRHALYPDGAGYRLETV